MQPHAPLPPDPSGSPASPAPGEHAGRRRRRTVEAIDAALRAAGFARGTDAGRAAGEPPLGTGFTLGTEQLAAVASLFWVFSANHRFLVAAAEGRVLTAASTWALLAALAVLLFGVHFLLLSVVATRWTIKPVLAVGLVVAATASYFTQHYGIYLDPTMLRNVLRTDPAEARELGTWPLVAHLALYALLPWLLLRRVPLARPANWRRAAAVRLGWIAAVGVVCLGTLFAAYQPLASLMRNHRELRYLVTPANVIWSAGAALSTDARTRVAVRQPVGLDARLEGASGPLARPRLMVVVVGETARADHWGLGGYARQTTPELARWNLVDFRDTTSCGTNTETSLPCMFSAVGRRRYDEQRIRGSESLLHLLARAGVAVQWRDNQAGCKGVCDGLPEESVAALNPPGLCEHGHCLDEALLAGLDERLATVQGTQVLVLHMLGSHGPAYFRRYPPAFARFQPACRDDDLGACTREEIVNAYDNSLLYTDHVLASLLQKLQAAAPQLDTGLLYVSDHGESLGEKGLYLHGVPYAIAPREQTQVPMLLWLSEGWQRRGGLDMACLQRRAEQPAAHDHLFHTLLALLQVRTQVYERAWDLTADCRPAPAP